MTFPIKIAMLEIVVEITQTPKENIQELRSTWLVYGVQGEICCFLSRCGLLLITQHNERIYFKNDLTQFGQGLEPPGPGWRVRTTWLVVLSPHLGPVPALAPPGRSSSFRGISSRSPGWRRRGPSAVVEACALRTKLASTTCDLHAGPEL